MRQSCIAHFGQLQMQALKIRKTFQVRQPRIGHFGRAEIQFDQARHVFQQRHGRISRVRPLQTQVRFTPG